MKGLIQSYPAGTRDWPVLASLALRRAWELLDPEDRDLLDRETMRKRVESTLSALLYGYGYQAFLVAVESRPAGYVLVGETRDLLTERPRGIVYAHYVLPEYRETMVGERLLNSAEEHCRRLGLTVMELELPVPGRPRRPYGRTGFHEASHRMIKHLRP